MRSILLKRRPTIHALISVCAGGRHAWYESSVGRIRKPFVTQFSVKETIARVEKHVQEHYSSTPWYVRLLKYVRSFFVV